MSALLQLIGIGWAIIGVANFFSMINSTPRPPDTTVGFSLLFQMMIFIIPGLILGGIGSGIKRKKDRKQEQQVYTYPFNDQDNKKCPYCAETIKAEAILCRYCNKELTA